MNELHRVPHVRKMDLTAEYLEHIRLPEDVRLSIAGQLHQGVSFQHILDNIRNSVGDDLKRIHLITRKDIRNTEKAK